MRISVITPSFNSAATLQQAIESVLAQDYPGTEHIIVDGGSTDGTLDLLKRYDHLKWVSEPDRGQVDAMRKGFTLSSGDVIGNLNADDYYLPGAFATVMRELQAGARFVVGKIEVHVEHNGNIWINDPDVELTQMLKHWRHQAFCVNPVGYFYRREVQDAIPFNPDNDDKHDLEFLLEVAARWKLRKVDAVLGVFRHAICAKTFTQQSRPSYWNVANFEFVERILSGMDEDYQRKFRLERECGYQVRRSWTVAEALRMGTAGSIAVAGELLYLPADESRARETRCGFVDFDRIATAGDWVVPILMAGKVPGHAIFRALSSVPGTEFSAHLYQVRDMNPRTARFNMPQSLPDASHQAVGLALHRACGLYGDRLRWKFITAAREPVSAALSAYCEHDRGTFDDLREYVETYIDYLVEHFFFDQFRDTIGLDVYSKPFDRESGFQVIHGARAEALLLRFEDLPSVFGSAVEAYFGISGLDLPWRENSSEAPESDLYRKLSDSFRLTRDVLDKVYSSRYVRHFYSDDEIARFFERWQQPNAPLSGGPHPRATGAPSNFDADRLSLIYDVGAHVGQDTEFYLKKGFRVIAIDANPVQAGALVRRFRAEIEKGLLVVLNIGIASSGEAVNLPFFVNERVTEWSSFVEGIAGRDGLPLRCIEIPVRMLGDVVSEWGAPYYVKIDIEGHDEAALRSLLESGHRPKYVSVENGNMGMLAALTAAGYTGFKYIQQNNVSELRLPVPAREGLDVGHEFESGSSGAFGEETPGDWLSWQEARTRIAQVWDPDGVGKNPTHDDTVDGWFDLHARFGALTE
jgi:FkbM family methyltransferase